MIKTIDFTGREYLKNMENLERMILEKKVKIGTIPSKQNHCYFCQDGGEVIELKLKTKYGIEIYHIHQSCYDYILEKGEIK